MKTAAILAMLCLAGCSRKWTCADVLGPHPTPGHWAVIPRGWRVNMMNFGNDAGIIPDYRVWDAHGKLVCDEEGRPVR